MKRSKETRQSVILYRTGRTVRVALPIIFFAAIVAGLGLVSPAVKAAGPIGGQWFIEKGTEPNLIRFTIQGGDGSWTNFRSSREIKLEELKGLSQDMINSSGVQDSFRLEREAGTVACEGWFKGGSGSGHFKFIPSNEFASRLAALGYSDVTDDNLLALAIHDVTMEFIGGLQAAGYDHLPCAQLIALCIHGVSGEFIKGVQSLGYQHPSVSELVAMRIHGVSPEFISELTTLGYAQPPIGQLVAMKIHGVDGIFISSLKDVGYDNIPVSELIAMKIHGVDAEYIKGIQAHGMRGLSVGQLIALKIQGL